MPLQSPPAARPPDIATFAGVLAALTAPREKSRSTGTESTPDCLDDGDGDVTLLSYERALKSHGRARTRESNPSTARPSLDGPNTARQNSGPSSSKAEPATDSQAAAPRARPLSGSLYDGRKRASVTIRTSMAEYANLQQRSAEAGLTVSAYLRSCAFEVDSLRAQVKQALAELRSASPGAKEPARPDPWWRRIFHYVHARQSV